MNHHRLDLQPPRVDVVVTLPTQCQEVIRLVLAAVTPEDDMVRVKRVPSVAVPTVIVVSREDVKRDLVVHGLPPVARYSHSSSL